MKRYGYGLLLLFILTFAAVPAGALTAETEACSVLVKQKYTLPVTAEEDETLSWSTSNKKVAKVSNGVVTGVGSGTAVITCKVKGKEDAEVRIHVRVYEHLRSASFRKGKIEMLCGVEDGGSYKTSMKLQPESGWNEWIYTSSNTSVAVCDEKGVIRAVGPGKCTITATSTEKTKKPRTASCSVTVKQAVTEVRMSETKVTTAYGKRFSLNATALPATAENRALQWSSSDREVARVDKHGNVTVTGYGSCVIRARATDTGKVTGECTVNVPSYLASSIYSGGGIRDDLGLFTEDDLAELRAELSRLREEYYGDETDGCPAIILYTCCNTESDKIGTATGKASDAFCDQLNTEYNVRNKTRKGMDGPIVITLNVWQNTGRADVEIVYTSSRMRQKLGRTHISEARSTMITGFRSGNSYVKGIVYFAEYIMDLLTAEHSAY